MNCPTRHKYLKKRGIKKGEVIYCEICKRRGCIPYGGIQGSLIYCDECFYGNCCQKELQHIIKCCEPTVYHKVKKRKTKRKKMTAQKKRKLRREKGL